MLGGTNSNGQTTSFAGKKTDANEIASLVGQLERYAERKTGRAPAKSMRDETEGFGFGGSNLANKPRRPASPRRGGKSTGLKQFSDDVETTAVSKWGAARGTRGTKGTRDGARAGVHTADENVHSNKNPEEYQNSLVGGLDGGSSMWEASSVQDSDVRSVYSLKLEDSFAVLPDAPRDRINRVDERVTGVSENLEMHRKQLEKTMAEIEKSKRKSDAAASLETDGMFTAGKSTTGVGVIDFFARDPRGVGPQGSLAQSVNERAGLGGVTSKNFDSKSKWLSPAPKPREKKKPPPEEPSPIMRMLNSVFSCGCGQR